MLKIKKEKNEWTLFITEFITFSGSEKQIKEMRERLIARQPADGMESYFLSHLKGRVSL